MLADGQTGALPAALSQAARLSPAELRVEAQSKDRTRQCRGSSGNPKYTVELKIPTLVKVADGRQAPWGGSRSCPIAIL
jgi:hypothetical protein